MLLGSGELGKETIIEAQRLGLHTIAVDRYEGAPGQHVADKAITINMRDGEALKKVVYAEKPDIIVPEIEAINLDALQEFEKNGFFVVPTAKATYTLMHRERTRELLAKQARVPTSKYEYANDLAGLRAACDKIGYPCWVKAIQSSSGHGSTFVTGPELVEKAFENGKKHARGSADKFIVEEHIEFDLETTELAVRHFDENGDIVTTFPRPVGHYQVDGDYHSSWQPADVSGKAERKMYEIAKKVTDELGGRGIFGFEMYVRGDTVWANECSPRPHDTGMVTFVTHQTGFSEAGLHVRAITGLPIPAEFREVDGKEFRCFPNLAAGASHVILAHAEGAEPRLGNVYSAINEPGVTLLFFGKPEAHVGRRMGLVLATAASAREACLKAERVAHRIELSTASSGWKKQEETRKHLVHE
jgi:phosphoribosylglycinamide formyltransferase 2